jgi:hypothetical protein
MRFGVLGPLQVTAGDSKVAQNFDKRLTSL